MQRRRQLARSLADAADLMIDFTTLGEYGLEPAEEPRPAPCRAGRRRATRLPAHARRSELAVARH